MTLMSSVRRDSAFYVALPCFFLFIFALLSHTLSFSFPLAVAPLPNPYTKLVRVSVSSTALDKIRRHPCGTLESVRDTYLAASPKDLDENDDSSRKENLGNIDATEYSEQETGSTTEGLFIPGFSDKIMPSSEKKESSGVAKTPTLTSPNENLVGKTGETSDPISEANSFAESSQTSNAFLPPKPQDSPPSDESARLIDDDNVTPFDIRRLARGELSAKTIELKAREAAKTPPPSKLPIAPKTPTIKGTQIAFTVSPDVIAAAAGGVLAGVVAGIYVDAASDILADTDLPATIPPAALGIVLGVGAFSGANQSGFVGTVTKAVFGKPVSSFINAVAGYLTEKTTEAVDGIKATPKRVANAAKKKVNDAVDDVRAVPRRVADAAKRRVDNTVEEIKAAPGRIADAAKQKVDDTVTTIKATPDRIAVSTEAVVKETIETIEDQIEKKVDEVVGAVEDVASMPGKKLNELSEKVASLAPKERSVKDSKQIKPSPPSRASIPKALVSTPKIATPQEQNKAGSKKEATAKFSERPKSMIPSIPLVNVLVSGEANSGAPKPPQSDIDRSQKGVSMPEIPVIPLPTANLTKKKSEKKAAKQKTDNFVFSEVSLKEFVKDIKPEVPVLDIEDQERGEEGKRKKLAVEIKQTADEKKPWSGKFPKIATPQKKEKVESTPLPTSPRPTFSLFGLSVSSEGSGPVAQPLKSTESIQQVASKGLSAPRGVPTISRWSFNKNDNTISGFISGSRSFKDGEPITTSAVAGSAMSNTVVRTKSGSKYFLGDEAAQGGGVFAIFGGQKTKPNSSVSSTSTTAVVDSKKNIADKKRLAEDAATKRAARVEAREKAAADLAEKKRLAEEKRKRIAQDAAAKRAAQKDRKKAADKERKRIVRDTVAKKSTKTTTTRKLSKPQLPEDTLKKTISRPTFSLFGLGNGPEENESLVTGIPQQTAPKAPRGMPTLSKWRLNTSDNTISGFISGSSAFQDGEPITTSSIKGSPTENTIVQTSTGSKYFLGEQSTGAVGAGLNFFGRPQSSAQKTSTASTGLAQEAKGNRADNTATRKVTEARKKAAAESAAKRAAAAEARKKAAAESAAKRAAAAEARKKAAAESAAKRAADAEARKKAAAESAAKRAAAAEARKQAAAESVAKRAAKAERQVMMNVKQPEIKARQESKRKLAEQTLSKASSGATISLFGFGKKSNDGSVSPLGSVASSSAPRGVPSISQWKQNRDGSITGFISGSSAFKDGDPITTSPIQSAVSGGTIVTTKSGSRYFLTELPKTVVNSVRIINKGKRTADNKKTEVQSAKKAPARKAAQRKRAQDAMSKASSGSTISLFKFGQISNEGVKDQASGPLQTRQRPTAPRGIPTLSKWRLSNDGTITGRISGSSNFKQGEMITTSKIARGKIESGSVVKTGSGSSYFLE